MLADSKRFFISFLLSFFLVFLWQKYFSQQAPEKTTVVEEKIETKQEEIKYTLYDDYQATKKLDFKAFKLPYFQEFYSLDDLVLSFYFSADGQNFIKKDMNFSVEKKEEFLQVAFEEKSYLKIKFFLPLPEQKKLFLGGKKVKELSVDDSKYEALEEIAWFGVNNQFHFLGFKINPIFFSIKKEKDCLILTTTKPLDSKFLLNIYLLNKDYETLKKLNFEEAAGYGLLLPLALPLNKVFKFFHQFISSYALVIIILTVIVRILVLPLQQIAVRNMKRMQVLQPKLQKIKELYPDNPIEVQKQTMELFKKEKVNPFGGCFPLLIQMPLFFAFYSVLNQSPDLVGSSFFWIQDLSQKDPFYIFPVLVAIAFFLQQKFTPTSTTMDPNAQKMMLFMPLIFAFFMKDLPSGLNLYMFVSTLLGFLTQKLLMKLYG